MQILQTDHYNKRQKNVHGIKYILFDEKYSESDKNRYKCHELSIQAYQSCRLMIAFLGYAMSRLKDKIA